MTSTRFATIVLWLAAIFFLAPGIWAFAAPHSFYEQVAHFEPYNRHLIHDVGAFQMGIGAALLLATRWDDARFVALAGAGVGASVHLLSHIIDYDLGGESTDVPVFALLAALLLLAAAARWRTIAGGS